MNMAGVISQPALIGASERAGEAAAPLPAHMTPFLQCAGLVKCFGDTRVVNDVSFSIEKGQCLALLGPSGCGKSTLLNMIAGIIPPDDGEIVCNGTTIDAPSKRVSVPMRLRRFAMVFQDFSLWPHMTVHRNVEFGLRMMNMGRADREARVAEALARVRMDAFATRYPAQLSGGQQQRVAIARALAVQPRVLLLDEPLSALDARLRDELRDELSELIHTLSMTTIFVTHDQAEALTIADAVAVMNRGRIEQIGSPVDIYRSPRSTFVAHFIGSSNIFEASAAGDLLCLGTDERWPAAPIHADICGTCLLRREHVIITPRHAINHSLEQDWIALQGVCERIAFTGERFEITARTEGGLLLRGVSQAGLRVGEPVHIAFRAEHLRTISA